MQRYTVEIEKEEKKKDASGIIKSDKVCYSTHKTCQHRDEACLSLKETEAPANPDMFGLGVWCSEAKLLSQKLGLDVLIQASHPLNKVVPLLN